MATIVQLPSGNYRAQVRRRGYPAQSKVFDTSEEAKSWADVVEAKMLLKTSEVLSAGESDELTLNAAYKLYIRSPAFLAKAPGTQRREEQVSLALLRILGDYALANIDEFVIQTSYIDKRVTEQTRLKRLVSADTVRLEKALLSSIFSFAKRRGYVKRNPALGGDFDMPRSNRREIRITPEQEAALFNVAADYAHRRRSNPNLIPWLDFVFQTGTRPGEAAKIELAWIHLDRLEIHIPRQGHKTRRPRVILISEQVQTLLTTQYNLAHALGSRYLFFSKSRGEYIPYRYSKPWRALCRLADIPDTVVPHGMRHEFISRLFEQTTLSDSQIAALVGDAHVLSLEPYKHLRTGALRGHYEAHTDELAQIRVKAHAELSKGK